MRLSLLAGQHTGFFLAMAGERSVPGFQWEKYEAWRGHPLLKFQWRNAAPGFFLGLGGFFSQQGLAVLLGDLVVVGVDFAEGEEAVAIAAEVDESRLQRWFYTGDLGQVDVALDLLVIGRIKVEFLDPVTLQHRHPGFFRVARIDKHARCHYGFSKRAQARASPADWRDFWQECRAWQRKDAFAPRLTRRFGNCPGISRMLYMSGRRVSCLRD